MDRLNAIPLSEFNTAIKIGRTNLRVVWLSKEISSKKKILNCDSLGIKGWNKTLSFFNLQTLYFEKKNPL